METIYELMNSNNKEKFLQSLFGNEINGNFATFFNLNPEILSSFEKLISSIYSNKFSFFKKIYEEVQFFDFSDGKILQNSLLFYSSKVNSYEILKFLIDSNKNIFDFMKIKDNQNKSAFIYSLEYIQVNCKNPEDFTSFDLLFPLSQIKDYDDIEYHIFNEFLKSEIYNKLTMKFNKEMESLNEKDLIKKLEKFRKYHIKIDNHLLTKVYFDKNQYEISAYVIYHPEKFKIDLFNKKHFSISGKNDCYYYIKNLSSNYGIDIKFFEENTLENIFAHKKCFKLKDISKINLNDDNDEENFDNLRGKKVKIIFHVIEFEKNGNLKRSLKKILIIINEEIFGEIMADFLPY